MKKLYYILFIAGLYLFSQAFQEYIVMYGALKAVAIGLVIAFACKFMFKMVTQTIIFIAVISGIIYFLISTEVNILFKCLKAIFLIFSSSIGTKL